MSEPGLWVLGHAVMRRFEGEIVAELRLGAAADDERRHRRTLKQPGERDLRRARSSRLLP